MGGGGWLVGGGCKVQKPEQLSLHDEQSEQSRAEREAELVNICECEPRKEIMKIISILAPGFSFFLALKLRFRLESLLKSAGQEQLY